MQQIKFQIVFWDWVGTLVSNKIFHFSCNNGIEFINKFPKYVPYAWHLVKVFHECGIKQMIVSNGSKTVIKNAVNLLNANQFFFEILTSENFSPKPDCSMIQYGLKILKVNSENAMFIGDDKNDEITAKNADIDFFQVNAKYESYKKILEFMRLS